MSKPLTLGLSIFSSLQDSGEGPSQYTRWTHIFAKLAKLRGLIEGSATIVALLDPLPGSVKLLSVSLVALEWPRAFLCLLQLPELDGLSLGLVGDVFLWFAINVIDKSLLGHASIGMTSKNVPLRPFCKLSAPRGIQLLKYVSNGET